MSNADRRPRAAVRALRLQFFVSGALFATWGVQVPIVKSHYALGDGTLALVLLAAGAGAMLALTQAGRLVGRFGPRRVTLGSGLPYAAAIASVLACGGVVQLGLLMLLFGAVASWFDVAINAEASELERLLARPLMSGFHGMFSLGGMAGAGLGGLALQAGVAPPHHLLTAALLAALAVLVGSRAMLPWSAAAPASADGHRRPRGALLALGLLAALGLIAEGAMYDWSVLFLAQQRGAPTALAAAGYAAFSAAMAAARFAGDRVRAGVAPVALLRASGLLAAAGMALALLSDSAMVGLIGFALVGLGFANVVPLLFSAAASVPGVPPAHGIAAVSSLGYLGMMAGPPIVGFIAQAHTLTAGLATVVLFALVLAAAARRSLP